MQELRRYVRLKGYWWAVLAEKQILKNQDACRENTEKDVGSEYGTSSIKKVVILFW